MLLHPGRESNWSSAVCPVTTCDGRAEIAIVMLQWQPLLDMHFSCLTQQARHNVMRSGFLLQKSLLACLKCCILLQWRHADGMQTHHHTACRTWWPRPSGCASWCEEMASLWVHVLTTTGLCMRWVLTLPRSSTSLWLSTLISLLMSAEPFLLGVSLLPLSQVCSCQRLLTPC